MITDEVQVDLFGVACNTNTPDADGNVWSVEEVRGWDGPDQRTQQVLPTGSNGGVQVGRYANGREVVVVGEVLADDQAGAWEVYNLLASSMPGLGGVGDVVVHEPGVAKSLTLVQAGPPKVDPPLHRSVRFMLTLLAEYPWKRALTAVEMPVSAGGSATFTAVGTFPAELKITTTSSGVVRVGSYGATIGTTASLPSGSVLDSVDRTITDDTGGDRYSLIAPQSQWLAVVPGSNTFTNTGTASVTLSYFPTYA